MTNPVAVLHTVNDHGNSYEAILIWCPGCEHPGDDGQMQGGLHMLPVNSTTKTPQWTYTGPITCPSLAPSILSRSEHHRQRVDGVSTDMGLFVCHSYLHSGNWKFLSDCTHPLAGQSVPMVPLPDWALS